MIDILDQYGLLLLVGQYPNGALGGLAVTLFLAIAGLVISFPLAVLIGVARTSPFRAARIPAGLIVNAVRHSRILVIRVDCMFEVMTL